ncbi:Reducing polyketide synthase BOA6, partial [Colletotrichum shisoi]
MDTEPSLGHRASCQPQEKIAIVGIGCRFPGKASSPSALWDLLSNPVDLSTPIPPWRFNKGGFYHRDASHHGTTNSMGSYLLEDDDVKMFDAQFFNIAPQEAESMDPQHRLLLEVVYEGLEDAGISLETTSGTATSAHVGLMSADWQDLQLRDVDDALRYLVTGGARSIASNRLSYFFNWHGPSETMSLRSGEASMAVAAGSNLLLAPDMYVMTSNLNMLSSSGKCHMWSTDADGYARGEGVACVILKTLSSALATGDHIYALIRETGVNQDGRTSGITMPSSAAQSRLIRDTYSRAGLDLTRKEDRCQFFEAHGTGTPAGDPLEAQAIWDAFLPERELGSDDAIDIPDEFYAGSVKTVMGHLEGCAGLAGLLKATLSIQRGLIPPNLHLGTPNPKIAPLLGPGRISVPTELIPWPQRESGGNSTKQTPRRASVNSFGFGGTNAHVILASIYDSEVQQQSSSNAVDGVNEGSKPTAPVIIVLSAASEPALAVMTCRYADYIEKHPGLNLLRLGLTTQRRRTRLAHGIFFTGRTRAALVRQMRTAFQAFLDGGKIGVMSSPNRPLSKPVEILGVFTGQGAQWTGMGVKLLDSCPTFARTMAESRDGTTQPWSLIAELRAPAATSRVGVAEFAQPLSTAVQVALVDVLRAAGVNFSAVVGHSSGELAAAYATGLISAADCIRMAYYRGRFCMLGRSPNFDTATNDYKKGGMVAVGLSMDEAQELLAEDDLNLGGHVIVACNNSPKSVTLSGDLDKLRELNAVLRERNIPSQMLRVDQAYHSPHMARAGIAYREALVRCRLEAPPRHPLSKACTWVSSVYPDWDPITTQGPDAVPDSVRNAQYWVENMMSPVRFREALGKAAPLGETSLILEVGPHPALRRQVADTWAAAGKSCPYRGTLAWGADDSESLAGLLGFLWQHGVPVDLSIFDPAPSSQQLSDAPVKGALACSPLSGLPSMPWQHSRVYWRESAKWAQFIHREEANCLLGHCIESESSYGGIQPNGTESSVAAGGGGFKMLRGWSWRQILRLSELPWLHGHSVQGQTVFPAAGYCVMAMDAAKQLTKDLRGLPETGLDADLELEVVELRDIEFGRAVVFPDKGNEGVNISLHLHDIQFKNHHKHAGNASVAMEMCAAFYIEARPTAVGEPGRSNVPHVACFGRIVGMLGSSSRSSALSEAMPPYIKDPVYLQSLSASAVYEAYAQVGRDIQNRSGSIPWNDALAEPAQDGHSAYRNPWRNDDSRVERLMRRAESVKHRVEAEILHAVAQNILRVMRQEEGPTILEVLLQNDMLARLYTEPVMYARANRYLGRVARVISHRYPRCKILEIGAGTGGATGAMFNGLDGAYSSYTFTGISSSFFAKAKHKFKDEVDRMAFKTLDVEKDPTEQEFSPATYDVVVASNVLHATKDIEKSLTNVRKLLKPGGFLLLLEITDVGKVLVPFLMGAVPGWWLFEDKWRAGTYSPLLPASKWDQVLRQGGFDTGTEFVFNDMENEHLSSVMVARATDQEWNAFRSGSTTSKTAFKTDNLMIIVGPNQPSGKVSSSGRLAAGVVSALSRFSSTKDRQHPLQIATLDGLEAAAASPLLGNSLVLVVSDLDKPALDDTKPAEWEALKHIFARAGHEIIWVTRKRIRGDDPKQNMVVGLGRCARFENPALKLQFVDLDDENCVDAIRTLALMTCQARVSTPLARDTSSSDTAWLHSMEPEVAIEKGRLMLPRLVRLRDADKRYLARRAGLVPDDEDPVDEKSGKAVVISTRCPDDPAIASTQAGAFPVCAPEELLASADAEEAFPSAVIHSFAATMVFRALDNCGEPSAAIVAIEPNAALEHLLTQLVERHETQLYVVTSRTPPQGRYRSSTDASSGSVAGRCHLSRNKTTPLVTSPGFTADPPYNEINFKFPKRWKRFSEEQPLAWANKSWQASAPGQASIPPSSLPISTSGLSTLVGDAIALAVDMVSTSDALLRANKVAMLDWRTETRTTTPTQKQGQTRTRRLLPNPRTLFCPDKTYLFAGITSDLGLSIAKWMAENGARSFALTSRSPKIPPAWLREMRKLGAQAVRVFSMDVTDPDSVTRTCDTISNYMAPVGGVVFGAMVLKDTLLENMPLETLQATMAPKVKGAHLVEGYYRDTELDFFIFMSSMSAIVGIRGQSNYCAGNMYGRALVANRRARGLAASTIDLSTVFGVGHFANAGASNLQTVHANLEGFNTLAIGEAELIDSFHEAIIRGPPEASATGEVIVGLGSETAMSPDQPVPAAWHDNPRFANFTARADRRHGPRGGAGTGAGARSAGTGRNVREELARSTTEEARLTTLSACFVARIQEIMQLSASTLRMDVPLTDLGIDSLVAVDLRGWFFKELEVSVPVLSILNGESVKD